MAHLKALGHSLTIEEVLERANSLYNRYAHTDLCEMAEKNRNKISQQGQSKVLRFLSKLL
jgi:uncharacterized protein YbcV (DUF1398 family)